MKYMCIIVWTAKSIIADFSIQTLNLGEFLTDVALIQAIVEYCTYSKGTYDPI